MGKASFCGNIGDAQAAETQEHRLPLNPTLLQSDAPASACMDPGCLSHESASVKQAGYRV
jgi:hypothetical protein